MERLRRRYSFPIFGIRPDDPVKKALLLCTPATARSKRVSDLKDRYDLTVSAPEGLVERIENNIYNILKGDCSSVAEFFSEDETFDSVLLGCTHFIFLSEYVKKRYSGAVILDGTEALTRSFLSYCEKKWGILTTDKNSGFLDKKKFIGADKEANYAIFCKMIAQNSRT